MAEIRCETGNQEIKYQLFCDGQQIYCGEKNSSVVLKKTGKIHLEIKTINEQIPKEKLIIKILKGFLLVLFSPIILLLMQFLPLPGVDNYFLISKSFDLDIENNDILAFSFIPKQEQEKKYIDIELTKNNGICNGNAILNENFEEIKQVKKELKLMFLTCFIAGVSISSIMVLSGILGQITVVLLLGLGVLLLVSVLSILAYMKCKNL